MMATTTGQRNFTSNTHEKSVLVGLNEIRMSKSLCDVQLVVDDHKFDVHRVVLASCSSYFRSMFTSKMKESAENIISLRGFSAVGLQHVLNFIYTSSVTIDAQNMQDILSAANHLQILSVVKFCCEFMQLNVSLENCFDIWNIARFFNLTEVEECALSFVASNVAVIAQSDEFLHLPEVDVCRLLSSNNIKVHSELDLFNAAKCWLMHDTTRLNNAFHVMQNIRFQLISPKDLVESVQSIAYMHKNSECKELLDEALKYHELPHKQPLLTSPRMCMRSPTQCLVVVGGLPSMASPSNALLIYERETGRWLRLGEMEALTHNHCVAVLNEFLYVLGGQYEFYNVDTIMANVYRYDPRFNNWSKMASMLEARANFTVSVIDSCLYAVAGSNKTGYLSSAERYIVDRNEWEPIADFPVPVCYHAGTACNGKLYIAGGHVSIGNSCEDVFCYEPQENKWNPKPKLKAKRAFHCMVECREKLYCIGGRNEISVLMTEMFDTNTEQWTDVAPPYLEVNRADAVVVEGKIYVMGGRSPEEREVVRAVLCYDSDRDVWEKVVNLPENISEVCCCALQIPATLLDEQAQHIPDTTA